MLSSVWELASATADGAAKRDTERQKEMAGSMRSGTTEKDMVGGSIVCNRLAVKQSLESSRKLARVTALSRPRSGFDSFA